MTFSHTLSLKIFSWCIAIAALAMIFGVEGTSAASLQLSPSGGTFTVGSTFNVAVTLDTEGQTVNAIDASLSFPAHLLQVISPTTGPSVVGLWTSPPRYDNTRGSVELRGGIPGGLNTSEGVVTTITFRVTNTGTASLGFLGASEVLLHDGSGTPAPLTTSNGIYTLILPPPAGPAVISETHPDQGAWHENPSVSFTWSHEDVVQGYSFLLSRNPIDTPDNISQGVQNRVMYQNLSDGRHYFHIKALRGGVWGGTTHYAVLIDQTPPASFPIEILPSPTTTDRRLVLHFITTDNHSGIDRYELRIVPLSQQDGEQENPEFFFIEAQSPYITPLLEPGRYDILVRAYDKAGNVREVTERAHIVVPIFHVVTEEGLLLTDKLLIPWPVLWVVFFIVFIILAVAVSHMSKHRRAMEFSKKHKELPSRVRGQLEELKQYREKYGKITKILIVGLVFGISGMVHGTSTAQEAPLTPEASIENGVELNPPVITTIPKSISNQDIFYIGGKSTTAESVVTVFLQNLFTGETFREQVHVDARGDWFYRHEGFLSGGEYIVWVQGAIGDQVSPPSPQVQVNVQPTAIQIGSSRISYELLYLMISMVLALILVLTSLYWYMHFKKAKAHEKDLMREVGEAEEAVRRGFAVLRRDVEMEIEKIHHLKNQNKVTKELEQRERELLHDLEEIERKIGKEVMDIEKYERI